jgi:hypothetical protein
MLLLLIESSPSKISVFKFHKNPLANNQDIGLENVS